MNAFLKKAFSLAAGFSGKTEYRRLFFLAALCLFALGEYLVSGLARRTFVFYASIKGNTVVEDRMIRRSGDREVDIRRYVDETLLGPVSPDSAALFPRDTRLNSFMYRDGTAYADFTESAAFPPPGGGDVFRSFLTLNGGIRRNFPYVKDVRIFIGGNEVFFEEFRGIFTDPADNSKTVP